MRARRHGRLGQRQDHRGLSLLAGRLGWPYAEADAFHSDANIARMAAGHPLTDEDRRPWLAERWPASPRSSS
jgi:gluconate kinase